ncbi:MAG: DEAD/DEAH box helicase [Candidatus Binatia bacterium]
MWWAMFDRHAMTEEELCEDLNCLGGLQHLQRPPEKIKQSFGFWYTFDPDQDTKLDVGSRCYFAHDLNVQTEIHHLDREQGRLCLKFGPTKLKQLPGGAPSERLSLIPDEYVRADVIVNSITDTATLWRDTQHLSPALEDFLLRRPPRITGRNGGPVIPLGADLIEATLSAIAALDRSTLCIQGPPGAGKTTVAAQAIVALLKQGKRIGIAANSHAAILNVLSKCHELADGDLKCLKIGGPREVPFFASCPGAIYAETLKAALPAIGQTSLIGGTAWVFSDPALRGTLDYLFVDEAGQVSVANLIGMAPAAHNLVLIGDQMQLGQPIQGFHPGESGLSLLNYLLQGQATIPEEMGVFLGTTWRLHPRVCDFISGTVYEGRLQPAPQTQHRIVRVPPTARYVTREAGILFIPVPHEGNTQGSDEEVAVIRELVDELVGREVTNEQGQVARRLQLEDMLVVAPYNMQVRKLSRSLGSQARVGSVDKFQGQEAPVVILSLCASSGEGSPRGLEFLLNKNRLNVALSRAQSLAIVVANPALAQTRCQSLSQMTLLNLFCRVMLAGGKGG